jgi:hypothetical protein
MANEFDIVGYYMIFGGIPYYLNMIDGRYGLPTNVDRLCFHENAPLNDEYRTLFASLFSRPEKYIQVIEAISAMKRGLTREEIKSRVNFSDGGNLTRILQELEVSGFVRMYRPIGKKKVGALYQLCDSFTEFYLTWMRDSGAGNDNVWSSLIGSGAHRAWSGYSFEQVCLWHISQIKKALGIQGVRATAAAWRSSESENAAQIDLVLDRDDNIVNLCEIKYQNSEFHIEKAYDLTLRNKAAAFLRETKTKKAIYITMVTTYGVAKNKYSDVFQSEVTMEALFE